MLVLPGIKGDTMHIVFTTQLNEAKAARQKKAQGLDGPDFRSILTDKISREGTAMTGAKDEANTQLTNKLEYLLDLLEGYRQCLEKDGFRKEELRPYLYQMGEISHQLQEIIASPDVSEGLKTVAKEAMLIYGKEQAKYLAGVYG